MIWIIIRRIVGAAGLYRLNREKELHQVCNKEVVSQEPCQYEAGFVQKRWKTSKVGNIVEEAIQSDFDVVDLIIKSDKNAVKSCVFFFQFRECEWLIIFSDFLDFVESIVLKAKGVPTLVEGKFALTKIEVGLNLAPEFYGPEKAVIGELLDGALHFFLWVLDWAVYEDVLKFGYV